MGGNMSRIAGCFTPGAHQDHHHYPYHHQDKLGTFVCEPSDEGLGHSFCYVRPVLEATPHLSPSPSGRYSVPPDIELPNNIFRQSNLDNVDDQHRQKNVAETSFKNISGASVSANTSTPRTITSREQFSAFANISYDRAAAFESTASFTSLPLQLVPRGLSQSGSMSGPLSGQTSGPLERGFLSGPIERGFMSGPLERGFLSGPLERGCVSGPIEATDRSLFSAPLSGPYAAYLRRRRRSLAQLVRTFGNPVKKVLSRSLSKTTSTLLRTQKSLTVPTKLGHSKDTAREGGSHCECSLDFGYESSGSESRESHNLQWAQGKAGEDRMHVVLSEEHGWLFVGIYDGFNGPDAPDFLMSNLYREVYKELRGLLWNKKETGIGKVEERVDGHGKGVMDCLDAVHYQEEDYVCRLDSHKDPITGRQESCSKSSTFLQCESSKRKQGVEDYFMDDEAIKSIHFDRCSYSVEADRSRMIGSSSANLNSNKLLSGISNEEPLSDDKMVYRPEWDACEPAVCGSLTTPESRNHSFTFPTEDHDVNNKVGDAYNIHQQGKNSLVKKQRKLWFRRLLLEKRDIKEQQKKGSDSDQDRKGLYKRLDDKRKQDDGKLYRNGNADHVAVLAALSRALASTEKAYLQMADHSMEEMPELALMGSCVLVMLMKGEDVYVMNVGDSRAVLAQVKSEPEGPASSPKAHAVGQVSDSERIGARDSQLRQELERIMEEPSKELMICASSHTGSSAGPPSESLFLNALQLSSDHSTNIEQEILRIKSEHPDDKKTISNERVKGRLKVTRAFGAGFLKTPRWNNALLEMFRIDYVGTAPYVTCIPALHHHVLGPNDRFLVLSSDGLYQYLSNEEVVAHVEWFMEKYPDGDPAQYLIEELLFRAAKKAGMDFHDLLDIPHGDRRKYHDDVSVMVISLEGRIWRSFG